jgi:hypothetical protein
MTRQRELRSTPQRFPHITNSELIYDRSTRFKKFASQYISSKILNDMNSIYTVIDYNKLHFIFVYRCFFDQRLFDVTIYTNTCNMTINVRSARKLYACICARGLLGKCRWAVERSCWTLMLAVVGLGAPFRPIDQRLRSVIFPTTAKRPGQVSPSHHHRFCLNFLRPSHDGAAAWPIERRTKNSLLIFCCCLGKI